MNVLAASSVMDGALRGALIGAVVGGLVGAVGYVVKKGSKNGPDDKR
jgi:hypothetical protein